MRVLLLGGSGGHKGCGGFRLRLGGVAPHHLPSSLADHVDCRAPAVGLGLRGPQWLDELLCLVLAVCGDLGLREASAAWLGYVLCASEGGTSVVVWWSGMM